MSTHLKTAIVTGGCSGIGLGLVKHLLAKPNWKVVIADIRPEGYHAISSQLDTQRHIFVETDVTSWDQQAALFKKAYAWSGNNQIDFVAANAGTSERDHITAGPWDLDGEPPKPDLSSAEVNLTGVFYGVRLFVYYARKTNRDLKASSGTDTPHATFNPKLVITSSCAGLYPFPLAPLYNATKHGVLALTRAVSPLLATDNIAVNCICPAYVDTAMTPSGVTALWPPEYITPISTMLRAYDELTDERGRVDKSDGKSDGEDGVVKAGQSVECVVDRLFYRKPVDYADESQKFLIEETFKPDGVWIRGMTQDMAKANGSK
ncbi:hypothetical protein PV10_01139 [Exophiala mesophila]|uniref:Uncharacterized protein n=1 Tax=Exophiala mesophila TaxID=212818 RepID=A0A0D2AEN9_EXOME|nr:uncharacterized protein PV10_01139 [Exophiala mesophila]KIV97383.1 hypothetical protein PV10_01139 [Exophiala mesophila]